MNNKKILGMPIALFVVGLLVIGGASAALVGYLSNTVETTAEVKSPIDLQQSLEYQPADWTYDSLGLGTVYGGDNTSFYLREEVLSESNISSNLQVIITNNEGIDGTDEISLLQIDGEYGTNMSYNATGDCVYQPGNDRLVCTIPSNNMDNGVRVYKITLGFAGNASGNYTANTRHVPQ